MSKNYDREQGIQAVIHLQAVVGITETREEAEKSWDEMNDQEKAKTLDTASLFANGEPTREEGIAALKTMRAVGEGGSDPTDYGQLWDGMDPIERAAVVFLAAQPQHGLVLGMVSEAMREALYSDEECVAMGIDPKTTDTVPPGGVVVEGVVNTYVFHPQRLMGLAPKVQHLLRLVGCELTPENHPKAFAELMQETDGVVGSYMECLVCLATGLGWAKSILPRELWDVLPAGLPVYRFNATVPPKIVYPADISALKMPKDPASADETRRYEVWKKIGGLPGKGGVVVLQELWERLGVGLGDARALTVEERAWVLANSGIDPDARREALTAHIARLGSDPSSVF